MIKYFVYKKIDGSYYKFNDSFDSIEEANKCIDALKFNEGFLGIKNEYMIKKEEIKNE